MDKSSLSLLDNLTKKAGLELSAGQLGAFDAFADLLIEKNRHVNLTAISDEPGIVVRHFMDSLSVAVYIHELAETIGTRAGGLEHPCADAGGPEHTGTDAGGPEHPGADAGHAAETGRPHASAGKRPPARLADVGSGAGFPGIPLKILYGDALDVTLIESTGKKVNFMNEAVEMLGLNRCKAVHARAEDAARRDGMRGQFGFATARALAPLPTALGYCLPLLARGGILIAMKGRRETAEKELSQAERQMAKLGGRLSRTVSFALEAPGPDPVQYERTLVIIERT